MERARGYKRYVKVGEGIGYYVNYYAHTAVRSDGTSDRNPANWQLLSTRLRGVNDRKKEPAPGCNGPLHLETGDREPKNHGLPTMLRTLFDEPQNGLKGNQQLV